MELPAHLRQAIDNALQGVAVSDLTAAASALSQRYREEVRDGRLHLFLPPLVNLADYVELIHAIEATAEELRQPVVIEGYEPPRDARLSMLQITPDPGVIEVNVQPCHSWPELVELSTSLYEHARQSRLATEKFMLDGRHTGTGGGNHVKIGRAHV